MRQEDIGCNIVRKDAAALLPKRALSIVLARKRDNIAAWRTLSSYSSKFSRLARFTDTF